MGSCSGQQLILELSVQGHKTYQTPFRCIGPIFTTWRSFSLFRIPSRRPRVIPATLSSLVPLIMWLSIKCMLGKWNSLAYHDQLTFSSRHANSLRFHLVAETALIFPQSGCHSGLSTGRCHLACGIENVALEGSPGSVPIPTCRSHAVIVHLVTIRIVVNVLAVKLTRQRKQLCGHLTAHGARWVSCRRGSYAIVSILGITGRRIRGRRLHHWRLWVVRVVGHSACGSALGSV